MTVLLLNFKTMSGRQTKRLSSSKFRHPRWSNGVAGHNFWWESKRRQVFGPSPIHEATRGWTNERRTCHHHPSWAKVFVNFAKKVCSFASHLRTEPDRQLTKWKTKEKGSSSSTVHVVPWSQVFHVQGCRVTYGKVYILKGLIVHSVPSLKEAQQPDVPLYRGCENWMPLFRVFAPLHFHVQNTALIGNAQGFAQCSFEQRKKNLDPWTKNSHSRTGKDVRLAVLEEHEEQGELEYCFEWYENESVEIALGPLALTDYLLPRLKSEDVHRCQHYGNCDYFPFYSEPLKLARQTVMLLYFAR